jgi:hypothetical protein
VTPPPGSTNEALGGQDPPLAAGMELVRDQWSAKCATLPVLGATAGNYGVRVPRNRITHLAPEMRGCGCGCYAASLQTPCAASKKKRGQSRSVAFSGIAIFLPIFQKLVARHFHTTWEVPAPPRHQQPPSRSLGQLRAQMVASRQLLLLLKNKTANTQGEKRRTQRAGSIR